MQSVVYTFKQEIMFQSVVINSQQRNTENFTIQRNEKEKQATPLRKKEWPTSRITPSSPGRQTDCPVSNSLSQQKPYSQ